MCLLRVSCYRHAPVEPCFAERTWTVFCQQHTANRREAADDVARAAQRKGGVIQRKAGGVFGAAESMAVPATGGGLD